MRLARLPNLAGLSHLVALLAPLALAGTAAAQAVSGTGAHAAARVDAGDVATLVLQIPAPAGVDSADYTLRLEPGYRAFVPTRGRVGRLDDLFLIVLTFATPERLPAGDRVVGRLELDMDGGQSVSRELMIHVGERREILFHLDLEETTVPPDGVTRVPYRLYNPGNLPDTVHVTAAHAAGWSVLDPPRLVLEAGDSVSGELRIAAPVSVSPGDRQLFVITARSAAREQSRTMSVVVVSAQGWLGGLAHVPSSLFIGQALGEGGGTVAALTGEGRVGPDTEVRVDLRYSESGVLDPALQREMAGAGLRVSLDRPDLRVSAGDIYSPSSTLTGSFRQARGINAEYRPTGPVSVAAFAAVPSGLPGGMRSGHIVHGSAGIETAYGQFEVLAGDTRRPALGTRPSSRSTGAGVRWAGERSGHSGSVEATVLSLAAGDSARVAGPAVQLDYRLDGERVSGRVAARRVPGAATAEGSRGNELSGTLSAEILPTLHLVGWGYGTDQARLGVDERSESRAANVGIRGRIGRLQLQLAEALTHRSRLTAVDSFSIRRHTVRADGAYVRGAFSIQSEVEIGAATERGREGPFRAVGSSLRWYSGSQSAWARVHHARRPGGLSSTSLQAGGSVDMGPVEISGGLDRSVTGGAVTTSFWSLTEVEVQRNLALHFGASARPTLDGEDWSFSIGLRRRLNLPLPMARQPDLYGVVFDDANVNGVRDPGERAVPAVSVALGYFEAETDDDGGFSFRDAPGVPLRIRSGRLPIGYVLSPDVVLPTRGHASIPLIRTATLQLELFLDRDEDGERDAAESAGSGVTVVVTHEDGRSRSATADENGRVRLTGLMPGHYAVTARPRDRRGGRVEPEVLMEVDLAPGGEVRHILPVPLRRRTIRMGGDEGGARP